MKCLYILFFSIYIFNSLLCFIVIYISVSLQANAIFVTTVVLVHLQTTEINFNSMIFNLDLNKINFPFQCLHGCKARTTFRAYPRPLYSAGYILLGHKEVHSNMVHVLWRARHESTSPIQKDQADSSRCMKALVILRTQDQKNLKIKEKDSGKPAVPRVSPFLFAPVLDLSKLDHVTY